MISDNLRLFLLIAVFSVIGFVILFRAYLYITEKYFLNEFTWLLQNTIFRSYLVFKSFAIFILLVYSFIAVYSIVLTLYWWYGLFILGCLFYLVFKIRKSKKEGKLNFQEDFIFQKYSTKVSFYNNQTEEYRRKSFESIIDKIKRMELNGIGNADYKKYLSKNFLLKIDQFLTFEYFDNRLYNSISDHYTTTLFYRKYLKNVLEIISRIDKQTDNLRLLNNNYQTISEILLNIKLIRFDDNQGLYYDISLVDLEIDKHLNSDNENFSLEKSLTVITQSLENLKLAFENNNLNHALSEQTGILNAIKEKINTITIESKFSLYRLPDNCNVRNIYDALIDYFARKSNIELLPKNSSDIEKLVKKRFRNNSNKQISKVNKDYSDRQFFIEHREELYNAVSFAISKYALEKKKLAEIILEELKSIGIIQGTIEGKSVCYCIDENVWKKIQADFNAFFNQDVKVTKCC